MAGGVEFIRSETETLLPIWFMIRDCIEGEPAIKGEFGTHAHYYTASTAIRGQARKYLPQPNPLDLSPSNHERYKQYVQRAYWYNFTSRTYDGLVGQIFLRPPVEKKPTQLDILNTNADGNGLSLLQVAKRATQSTMAYGRAGMLTDYPTTDGTLTPDDIKNKGIQPTIRYYYPWQIRNWSTVQRGAKHVVSLVVLEEYVMEEDNFALLERLNYRVLRLDPTTWTYSVEVWERDDVNKGFSVKQQAITPRDANGKTFDEIPFSFVGSEANDVRPDKPPMYDLASLNIAHYRNSADYEESCHIVGQPTPVISGLTEEWATNILKGIVTFGARAAIMLPVEGKAELLQAKENTMPLEAMKMKQDQAIALGAKLVHNQKTIRTATEVMVDTTSESSTLHNVAINVSAAMENNLRWAARFVGAPEDGIEYKLNTEFELTRMNANDRLAVVKLWQSGAIAFSEMRDVLRVDGTAQLDDKEAATQIAAEMAAAATLGGAPIADPLQAKTPTAPENQPATPGGTGKQQFPVVPVTH